MSHRKSADPSILIIDDDAESREGLAELLVGKGFSVATALDGADGLTYLRHGHRPKVILLDLMMPGVDGWDFRAEQKRDDALASIRIIAISAAGKLMDADHTLRKPINIEALLKLLEGLLLEPAAN
jgi:CheY-like chemotaxis protein